MAAVQSISATSRDEAWTIAPKCWPSSSSGRKPVSRSAASDRNVRRASATDRPDEVGGVLDEEAVALLRFAQLAFQALALADVADRALGADPATVLEDAGRRDLGRERGAVAADQDQRHALDEVGVGADGRVLLERQRHRVRVGQEREVLADDLLDRPAEQRLGRCRP